MASEYQGKSSWLCVRKSVAYKTLFSVDRLGGKQAESIPQRVDMLLYVLIVTWNCECWLENQGPPPRRSRDHASGYDPAQTAFEQRFVITQPQPLQCGSWNVTIQRYLIVSIALCYFDSRLC